MALVGPKAKKERGKRSGGEKHLSLGSQVLPMQRPVGLSVLMENSSGWDFDRLKIYNGHRQLGWATGCPAVWSNIVLLRAFLNGCFGISTHVNG